MDEPLLVRLKPYNPHRGFVMRSYTTGAFTIREERGWHRVPAAVANELRSVRQVAEDPHSALAFDVCTEAEAQALDEAEAEAKRQRKDAHRATDLTTVDLAAAGASRGPERSAPAAGGKRGKGR